MERAILKRGHLKKIKSETKSVKDNSEQKQSGKWKFAKDKSEKEQFWKRTIWKIQFWTGHIWRKKKNVGKELEKDKTEKGKSGNDNS